jgi:membrane-associated phospholipid phosphatase
MLAVIMFSSGCWVIGLVMLIWALLVIISRVGLGVHYFSDVAVGGLIGIVMGFLAVGIFSLLS